MFTLLIAVPSWAASGGAIQVDLTGVPGELLLDGFPTGLEAPATLEGVAPGSHVIELTYGCMSGSATVEVEREKTTTADLTLQNQGGNGTLRVSGLPRGATVFIDDAPVSDPSRGIEVRCGGHRMLVESPGFESFEDMFVVTTDRWTTITPGLVEADLEADTMPEAALYDLPDEPDIRREYAVLEDEDEISDFDLSAAEVRQRDEEARQKAAAEAARLQAAERQARLSSYGIDDLDDDLDDEVEEDRSRWTKRKGGKEEETRVTYDDDLDDLDNLDDDGLAEADFGGDDEFDDFDDFDEDGDFDEDRDFDEDDDEPRYADLDERAGGNSEGGGLTLPTKWIVAGGSTALGGAGIAVGIIGIGRYNAAMAEYDKVIIATNDVTDPAALAVLSNDANPARRLTTIGFVTGGIGLLGAGGAVVWLEAGDGFGTLGLAGRW